MKKSFCCNANVYYVKKAFNKWECHCVACSEECDIKKEIKQETILKKEKKW